MKENNDIEYMKTGRDVKRNYKDGLFCTLFNHPKNALDLYRMLHPEDKDVDESDIEPIAVNSIFSKGTVNDVAFRVKDHTFFLMESQTDWTDNIILRCYLYVAKFYMEYFAGRNRDLHRTRAIRIPLPEVYIYYTGEKDVPEVISFADTYGDGRPQWMDLKARVIRKAPPETLLGQYDYFCGRCKATAQKGQLTRESLSAIIDECIGKDILQDFLTVHRSEAMDMLEDYWDIEGIRQVEDEELREQVTKDVTAKVTKDVSSQKNAEFILILKSTGKSAEEIAGLMKLPLEQVESILEAN